MGHEHEGHEHEHEGLKHGHGHEGHEHEGHGHVHNHMNSHGDAHGHGDKHDHPRGQTHLHDHQGFAHNDEHDQSHGPGHGHAHSDGIGTDLTGSPNWFMAYASAFGMSVISFVGVALLGLLRMPAVGTVLEYSCLAFAGATLIADALLHLLPHALEGADHAQMSAVGISGIAGSF